MEKPTIFLSHSSSDKEYILKLKKIITSRTSNTVEVFQSSDGESIPFGNNWIHKIEENLKKTKIMLVFVSPKSASSAWIYFESGFAYGKEVKVIPIGISGIDIGSIKPPLNLLQGFNINSADGLGNLITVINREFKTTFNEDFLPAEYAELAIFDQSKAQSDVTEKFKTVKINLYQVLANKDTSNPIKENCLEKIEDIFNREKINYHNYKYSEEGETRTLTSHGIKIIKRDDKSIDIYIATEIASMYEPLINEIPDFYEEKFERCWLEVIPSQDYKLVTNSIETSSKLHKKGFQLSDRGNGFYELYGWNIKMLNGDPTIAKEPRILINFPAGKFKSDTLCQILSEVIEVGILYK